MPWPSSMTRIIRLPPASVSTRIVLAPASSAFSRISFTTEAGRSTTSPAAILFATASGNMRIRLMSVSFYEQGLQLARGSTTVQLSEPRSLCLVSQAPLVSIRANPTRSPVVGHVVEDSAPALREPFSYITFHSPPHTQEKLHSWDVMR